MVTDPDPRLKYSRVRLMLRALSSGVSSLEDSLSPVSRGAARPDGRLSDVSVAPVAVLSMKAKSLLSP
jgi:hypothetical protein